MKYMSNVVHTDGWQKDDLYIEERRESFWQQPLWIQLLCIYQVQCAYKKKRGLRSWWKPKCKLKKYNK